MSATEPQPLVVSQRPPGTGLPDEVLASAIGRVRVAALTSGTVWTLVLAANLLLSSRWIAFELEGLAGWPHPNWIYALVGAAGSFGLAYAIRWFAAAPRTVLDLGLGFEVFTAALISLISFHEIAPHAARISWVTVVILVYPAIAPAAPRRVLAAGLIAASTDAGAFALALARGQPMPGTPAEAAGILAWMLAPNYLCAFLALVPATLIRRLGREAGAARELGSYRLGRLIGRGGMGEVYEASHRLIARPAAIKLIRPELLTRAPAFADMLVERFYREAESVARLRSPHTVALYDFGIAADGTPYHVMELLDGIDLQRLVERFGPQPPERVSRILAQVCDSLGEAHAQGMVHRDVKPANIVLCRLGTGADFVKVLDFGLVRHDAVAAPEISAALGTPGTPAYMAPETVHGGTVDHRADLYALGCVAYWLLTGRTVFEGDNPVQIMYHHGYRAPVPPSVRVATSFPDALEQAVLAVLSKSPDDRPATAAEFARLVAAGELGAEWDAARAKAWWDEHCPGQPGKPAP